jgi:hypothetical protein
MFNNAQGGNMKKAAIAGILCALAGGAIADAKLAKGALPAQIYNKSYQQYTKELEAAIKLQTKNQRCAVVQYGAVSSSKSRPGSPVFFVNCDGHDGSTFNTWYTLDDIKKGQAKSTANLSADDVRSKCFNAIKSKLNQPSTFSPHLLDYSVRNLNHGRSQARIGFTAENMLGNELDYVAQCLVGPSTPAEVTIQEK